VFRDGSRGGAVGRLNGIMSIIEVIKEPELLTPTGMHSSVIHIKTNSWMRQEVGICGFQIINNSIRMKTKQIISLCEIADNQ
jgi:hypothetical protein